MSPSLKLCVLFFRLYHIPHLRVKSGTAYLFTLLDLTRKSGKCIIIVIRFYERGINKMSEKKKNIYKRDAIADAFFNSVSAFSEAAGAIGFRSELLYDKNKAPDGMVCVADHRDFKLEYTYTVSAAYLRAPSVFNIRVIFDYVAEPVKYPLYDIMYLLDPGNFKCYRFSYIESPETFVKCFDSIKDDLSTFIPRLSKIAADSKAREDIEEKFFERIKTFLHRDLRVHPLSGEEAEDRAEQIETFLLWSDARFDTVAYADYLSGRYTASIKKYRRFKNKSLYEMRLLSYMEGLEDGKPSGAVAPECNTVGEAASAGAGGVEYLQFVIGWLILIIPSCLAALGVYYLFSLAFAAGGLYATQYSLNSALFSIVTGLLCSVTFSPYVGSLGLFFLKKKKREIAKKFNGAAKLKKSGCFSIFTKLILALAIVITFAYAGSGIVFNESGMRVRDHGFQFEGRYIAYSDVEYAATYEGVYDIYGEWVEGGSLAISLTNGSYIDLGYSVTEKQIEEKIIPILEAAGIEIRHIRDGGYITHN